MDEAFLRLINHTWVTPALDMPMAILSSWDFWWPLLVVLGSLILWRGGFRARSMILTGIFSIGFVDGFCTNSLKPIIGRPRPHQVLEGVRMLDLAKARPRLLAIWLPLNEEMSRPMPPPQRGRSFPSGHAANNFAIATVVFLFYRRFGWLAYLPAAFVAYSRIYVGSHWPTDVLVGIFIGICGTLLVVRATDRLWRWVGPRWLPALAAAHPHIPPRP
jgi:undecaprenyl-diphosphatase